MEEIIEAPIRSQKERKNVLKKKISIQILQLLVGKYDSSVNF
jgi:hypothetical protein